MQGVECCIPPHILRAVNSMVVYSNMSQCTKSFAGQKGIDIFPARIPVVVVEYEIYSFYFLCNDAGKELERVKHWRQQRNSSDIRILSKIKLFKVCYLRSHQKK